MKNIYDELKAAANVLEIIDRKRLQTGDPGLGAAIERRIINRCLAQIEQESINPVPSGV